MGSVWRLARIVREMYVRGLGADYGGSGSWAMAVPALQAGQVQPALFLLQRFDLRMANASRWLQAMASPRWRQAAQGAAQARVAWPGGG